MRAVVTLLLACSGDPDVRPFDLPAAPEVASEPPAPPSIGSPRYAAAEVPAPATVTGTVRWRGPRPPVPTTRVGYRADICGAEQPAPVLTVGAGNGVADVVVALVDPTQGLPKRPGTVVLEHQQCRLTPHVLGAAVGTVLEVRNQDATLHNTHVVAPSGADILNAGLPGRGTSARVTLRELGVHRVLCDAGHPWTLAYVATFDHPYFAVTSGNGSFRLEGVPPGRHRLRATHQGVRATATESGRPVWGPPIVREQELELAPGGSVDVTLDL